MAVKRKSAPKGAWVVLVDNDTGDGTGELEVCCGRSFTSEASARKEASRHAADAGDGRDDDCNWIAVAKITVVGKRAPVTFTNV